MIKFQNRLVILFDFRKKLKILLFSAQNYTLFLISLLDTRDRKSRFFLYCGPWMQGDYVTNHGKNSAVFDQLELVSWAVRYLDKPR